MNFSIRQQITLALRTGIGKLWNVDLEHGHVYIVNIIITNYLQKGESNTSIAYQK